MRSYSPVLLHRHAVEKIIKALPRSSLKSRLRRLLSATDRHERTNAKYRQFAQSKDTFDALNIFDDACVSRETRKGHRGAFVMCWFWVRHDRLKPPRGG